ncbi:MAG: cation:proton antiporter [Bacteroidales bacterium]|nr:cation:proton antiporter [Bacteroidales bacterium]
MELSTFVIFLIGFLIVALAANQIALVFQKIKLPLITGFIITGLIAGSSVLNFITPEAIEKLDFLNQIALSIIAFAAGSELYLNELRSRMNSIKWMTLGQLIITFVLSSLAIYYLANYIPFMADLPSKTKIAIAILFGTIFVARSPSSAIAVINEMRANGPFTKTVIGVTVVIDVLVIILFAISFSIAKAFINNEEIGFLFLLILLSELLLSIALGLAFGKIFQLIFSLNFNKIVKSALIILIGYSVYLLASFLEVQTEELLHYGIRVEPLLICIVASFFVTNYTIHRIEFYELLEKIGPVIFIIFFTLIGASLSFPIFVSVFGVAILLFLIRLITMFIGGTFGVAAAKDLKQYTFIAWMPYVTQAGVALGLVTIVAHEFKDWGTAFETIVIAIIVINQLIGPPLFKWAINIVEESHLRAKKKSLDGKQDVVIIGIESQSIALANQLVKHNWIPRMVSADNYHTDDIKNFEIFHLQEFTLQNLKKLELKKAEAIVLMLSDTKNYEIAELIYEHFGTKEIIVRLNKRENFEKFHKLGARIIEPATAIVSLLDHFVRSPNAATLLLGWDEGQDTIDVEVKNIDIHGLRLRELRIPSDIIVLSVKRDGHIIISHGYTRLRLGDIITFVGAEKSLHDIMVWFDSTSDL